MPIQPTAVSVTTPVAQAIDGVKQLLFRPFDLSKWFTIGFCAWLAHLGEAGYRFNFGSRRHTTGSIHEQFERARTFVMDNLSWIVPLVIVLVIVCFTIGVVMLWVSSRGKFMFLHCLASEKAEIEWPWRRFVREGNSLFLFRLVLGLIGMTVTLPLLTVAVLVIVKMVRHGAANWLGVVTAAGAVLMLVAAGTVLLVIMKLTTDFVVPIMFLRGNKCMDGWRELLGLISLNVGNFVVYLLFQIVLAMATGAIVLLAILVTCCTAGCLMMIPYLGTVLLLPVLAFKRSYSLHYLAQYGRQYDVFPSPLAPA